MNIISFYVSFKGGDASVNSVHLSPKNAEHVIVCNKTSSIYLMTLQGQVFVFSEKQIVMFSASFLVFTFTM